MRYLKNFVFKKKKVQPLEDIEKLSTIRSEVGDIFYILKDEGFKIIIQYLKFREFKYIMITISDINGLVENPDSEAYDEFLDRLKESVNENGLKLSFCSTSLDPFTHEPTKGAVIIVGSKGSPSFNSMRDLAEASKKGEIEMFEIL